MELESYKNGKLLHQGAKEGEKIAVNDLLCIIGEEGKVDVAGIIATSKRGNRKKLVTRNKQTKHKEKRSTINNQRPMKNNKPAMRNQKPMLTAVSKLLLWQRN